MSLTIVMIDLGAVRFNQNMSMIEVDDQERLEEQQRQEEVVRANLLQEELRAAQEQQRQEEVTRQHQADLVLQEELQLSSQFPPSSKPWTLYTKPSICLVNPNTGISSKHYTCSNLGR